MFSQCIFQSLVCSMNALFYIPFISTMIAAIGNMDIGVQQIEMDNLNEKYGRQKIKMANQDLQRTWKMRQAYLSPEYTTKFSDIITLNCDTI